MAPANFHIHFWNFISLSEKAFSPAVTMHTTLA